MAERSRKNKEIRNTSVSYGSFDTEFKTFRRNENCLQSTFKFF